MSSTEDIGVEEDKRQLASVQYLRFVGPIAGKDQIVEGQVLGYTVIFKPSDFPGILEKPQLCVFFEPDALLDEYNPELDFLKPRKWRIRTMKMACIYSQGLALPLRFAKYYGLDEHQMTEGMDVTKSMKVRKYVAEEEKYQYQPRNAKKENGVERRMFPSHIAKTDEENVQRNPALFRKLWEAKVPVTITEKIDGCSATFWAGGLASRNFELITGAHNKSLAHYFEIDFRYNLREKMKAYPDLAVQGEIFGPNVNHNRLRTKQIDFAMFNVWNSKQGRYLPWADVQKIAAELGVPTVPVLFQDKTLEECGFQSWQDLMNFVNPRLYANGHPSEGVVCKGFVDQEFISFKVVSREYLSRLK